MTTAEKLFSEARALEKSGDSEKAATLYLGAAELGYVPAQLSIGVACLFGKGVAQNYETAVFWLKKAAEQNNISAVSNLAYCYNNGYGVAKDELKAMELYKKAANLGDATASKQYEILQQKLGANTSESKASGGKKENIDPVDFLYERMGLKNPNVPVVNAEVRLVGPREASTQVSVYVPEFKQSIQIKVPNNIEKGQSVMLSESLNEAVNGIKSAVKVNIVNIVYADSAKPAPAKPTAAPNAQKHAAQPGMDIGQRVKAAKRRIYIKPVINLFFTAYFILSLAGLFITMGMYPNGGAPDLLMNIIGIGFTFGFLVMFYFNVLPYLFSRYPDPGFFKIRKVMKNLEKRNLLKKAVVEMETCTPVAFGDKMCLSDNFLFHKKKAGVIIPCDELLWIYVNSSPRRARAYVMLGTRNAGIHCFTCIKRGEQAAAYVINALQRRNPSVLVGDTRENRKKYFQLIKQ